VFRAIQNVLCATHFGCQPFVPGTRFFTTSSQRNAPSYRCMMTVQLRAHLTFWALWRGGGSRHGVETRQGAGWRERFAWFSRSAAWALVVAYGQMTYQLANDTGQITVSRGAVTMRAHAAPLQECAKRSRPRPHVPQLLVC